jgi:CheY-like chemotaxis protein
MPPDMSKPVLLLVEDSDDDVFFFRRTFQKLGTNYRLHHALNGAVAIEFLREAASADTLPRIIFLDLKMPVLNGFDVLNWMQKQKFAQAIPVIVLSGSDQQKDKDMAFQLGATDYIAKPMKAADLQIFLQHVSPDSTQPQPAASGARS